MYVYSDVECILLSNETMIYEMTFVIILTQFYRHINCLIEFVCLCIFLVKL